MQIVGPGMMGTAKCQDRTTFKVLDVIALTAANPSGWSEKWTAEACGTNVEAQVTYTATGTGMNITASKLRVP